MLKRIVSSTRVLVLRLDVMSPFATMTLSSLSLTYLIGLVGGFCQGIPSAITLLIFWKLLLFQGSMSRVCAPCLSLDWHKLKIVKFYGWWTTVTIKDLRHNIDKLCSAVESSSPNLKR
ncbi:Ribosomal RNA large subunit methyltransferase F, partial [Bienertia sinuspersici]